jgi:protein gp37
VSDRSAIEWTDATWNPIRARRVAVRDGKIGRGPPGWHCEHVSPGCEHCYAEGINKRLGTGLPFKPGHRKDIEIFLDEVGMLLRPLRWKKSRMIFVCSMTDLFADFVKDEWIHKIFALMALCPQHTFQVLTKRPKRMRDYFLKRRFRDVHPLEDRADAINDAMNYLRPRRELRDNSEEGPPFRNVWLGISAEDQTRFDERWYHLRETPAAVKFVSFEPLLGDIVFRPAHRPGPDWAIVGGESGPHARPMHPDWARSLRDQCREADVPFFYKQTGEWASVSAVEGAGVHYQFPDGATVRRVGKKAAGRLLDGVEHNGFPQVAA